MAYFAISIFLSAFLLFQVEPMIAKYILPWFGGSPGVWSAVMMYFQVLLTGGYAYAAWLMQRSRRVKIHIVLVVLSVFVMAVLGLLWKSPITPGSSWKPENVTSPFEDIIRLLTISVGLPYFLLSANSPVIQAWFHARFPRRTAYRLYSLSNIGSLLALITYPVLVEPHLTLAWQGRLWSIGYLIYGSLTVFGARKALQRGKVPIAENLDVAPTSAQKVRGLDYGLWIGLAAMASLLLLAVTSQITQEVASIPFLWVLPLTIYLLSFVLAFSSERWYSWPVFIVLFLGCTLLASRAMDLTSVWNVWKQIGSYSLLLFAACMVCHGELYRLRPHPARLTTFYLMVSIGGALGGLFINFVAPYIFKGYWELSLGLPAGWLIFLGVTIFRRISGEKLWLKGIYAVVMAGMVIFTSLHSAQKINSDLRNNLTLERNFYGVLKVRENYFTAVIPIPVGSIHQTITSYDKFTLVHGITNHGFQFHDANLRNLPTTYYGPSGGAGLAILNSAQRGNGMRVGILGLGVGTLSAYGEAGDVYRFYEINPQVTSLAKGKGDYFSYLEDSKAQVEIIPGDARLSLETELERGEEQNYDVLVLDVFSSDSIPVHLIDAEAFDVYMRHLKPDGILAVHITNSHLDLTPVVWGLADHLGLARSLVENGGDGIVTYRSKWILLSRSASVLAMPAIANAATPMDGYKTNIRLWTDDYNNLFQILH